jgi:hypothetical protein
MDFRFLFLGAQKLTNFSETGGFFIIYIYLIYVFRIAIPSSSNIFIASNIRKPKIKQLVASEDKQCERDDS